MIINYSVKQRNKQDVYLRLLSPINFKKIWFGVCRIDRLSYPSSPERKHKWLVLVSVKVEMAFAFFSTYTL